MTHQVEIIEGYLTSCPGNAIAVFAGSAKACADAAADISARVRRAGGVAVFDHPLPSCDGRFLTMGRSIHFGADP